MKGVTSVFEYTGDIVMPTSIHISKPLLDAVNRQARKLRVSRNRFIVQALEKQLATGASWSPGFFDRLERVQPQDAQAVDEMLDAIRAGRTRKPPRQL